MRKAGFGLAVLLAVVAAAPSAAFAEGNNPIAWKDSYRDALTTAQTANKPLLIKITSADCSHCARLDAETMTAEPVVEVINDSYVSLALDATRDAELVGKLRVNSVPATLVVAPDRRIVRRIAGFQDAETMTTTLVNAIPETRSVAPAPSFNRTNTWSGGS